MNKFKPWDSENILPINPPEITSKTLEKYQPAYLSNGLLGLRIGKVPICKGKAVLNGYVGMDAEEKIQGSDYVPFPIAADICIENIWLGNIPELALFMGQSYDFSCGELKSYFDFSVENNTLHVEVNTFCSRSLPTLCLQEIKLTADKKFEFSIKTIMDFKDIEGECLRCEILKTDRQAAHGSIEWQSTGGLSKVGAAYTSMIKTDMILNADTISYKSKDTLGTEYKIIATPGYVYTVHQISSLVPSIMHHEPERQAIRMVNLGVSKGYDILREENKMLWKEIWESRIYIISDNLKWQAIADAAFFYLQTSIHQCSPCSTGLFGINLWDNYHYFRGHVFWDIETFAFPILLLTAPHAAKSILDYRFERISAAKYNASMNGYRGLQFPWESGTFGEEVTPVEWPGILHEIHISLDIAFAFCQYVHATNDEIFLKEKAWPVIKGVAEWISSRVSKTQKGYEILNVTGIDEGAPNVNNNAFTNCLTIVVITEAINFARKLGYNAPCIWVDIKEKMYLPINENNVLLKYDGFEYSGGVCCPDPLAAFYPFTFKCGHEVESATYRYYLDRVEDYIGYPMLSSLLCVYASRAGDPELSQKLLEEGVAEFVIEPFTQFDEFSRKKAQSKRDVGPYIANLSGFLTDCLYGFTGLEIVPDNPENWFNYPVSMPRDWEGIAIKRIWIHGKPTSLFAKKGEKRATFNLM